MDGENHSNIAIRKMVDDITTKKQVSIRSHRNDIATSGGKNSHKNDIATSGDSIIATCRGRYVATTTYM